MREQVLRAFFEGEASAAVLAADAAASVSASGQPNDAIRVHHRIEPLDAEFEVEPWHLGRLVDAAARGELTPAELATVSFCLVASDHFTWDTDTANGKRVADALFWLGSPEINYPLVPDTLKKIEHYLVTGADTLRSSNSEPGGAGV
jgi:hypothetical protein